MLSELKQHAKPQTGYNRPIKTTEAKMETKGKWNISNLSGVSKTFATSESPDAYAWMRNRGDAKQVWNKAAGKWEIDPKVIEREDKKAERERVREEREEAKANKPKKLSKDEL